MGHWGWRRLAAVFISVWVIGCSPTHDAAPTAPPTQPPSITLIARFPVTPSPLFTHDNLDGNHVQASPTPVIYTVQAGDTLLQVARRFGVELPELRTANGGIEPLSLQIGQELLIPSPQFNAEGWPILPTSTPARIELSSPYCYAAPTEHIICLGQITNSLDEAIERVSIHVGLLKSDGRWLVEGESAVEQSIIPPGETAPYRLLFRADWEDFAGAVVRLESADSSPDAEDRYIVMDVEDQDSHWVDGRYAMSAVLHNSAPESAQLVRAVVTLWDDKGQITGYRVARLNHVIAPGERIPFEIKVMSSSLGSDIAHSIYLEALRLP